MNKSITNQSDNPDYNINFLTGIYCLMRSKYKQSRDFFLTAVYETNQLEKHYPVYLSYVGLSAVLTDHKDGVVRHCYHSSNASLSIEPEVQLNLACAEFISGNRKRGIQAISKFDGFVPTRCSKEINSFFDIVGKRKKSANGLPKRNHIAHKTVGRIFRTRRNVDTNKIEAFIKETAKNRYKRVMFNQNY